MLDTTPAGKRKKMGNVAIIISLKRYLILRQSTQHYNSSPMCKKISTKSSFVSRVMGMYPLKLPSPRSTTTSMQ